MGIDGGDYSRSGKRGIGFGSHVCRAGFLCETARGDFRFGDSIENGARQSRAPLRAMARTRANTERLDSLDDAPSDLRHRISDLMLRLPAAHRLPCAALPFTRRSPTSRCSDL